MVQDRDPPGTGDSPLDDNEQPSSQPDTEQPDPQPDNGDAGGANPNVND